MKLAIWILSIVANSAGSECGFSKFGNFLTKLRNQLAIQKVRKMTIVDNYLKREHEEFGMVTDRVKRKFIHLAEQCGAENSMGYEESDSFEHLATQLIRETVDARTEQGEGAQDVDEDDIPAIHSASHYTLKKLFQFPENPTESLENGLGFYWQGGIKDLQEELELYDLLMEESEE